MVSGTHKTPKDNVCFFLNDVVVGDAALSQIFMKPFYKSMSSKM